MDKPALSISLPPIGFEFIPPVHHRDDFDRRAAFYGPHEIERAFRQARTLIEKEVQPAHFRQPFVQAAAWLLVDEFLVHPHKMPRATPKCWKAVQMLLRPFLIGYVLYG